MAFRKVAERKDVRPGTGKAVEVGGRTIALWNVGGTFHAIDDECTHVGGPLSEGELDGTTVRCPWHGAEFDVTTGKVLCPPAGTSLACYKVQIVGEDVQIDVP
ncbi:MAG: non-heme iron oxygenase ferredoxin subunit [Planctomycetes bacterium]|nr:non-heme iron oxygenase ferredoxin subunit [Planctomycetota bacterium]